MNSNEAQVINEDFLLESEEALNSQDSVPS